MRVLSIIIILISSFSTFAQRQEVDRVIGIVGNEIILRSEVEAQYKIMTAQGGTTPDDIRCIIFEQLLSNALILAEAEKDSVTVTEVEVDAQIDARISQILAYMGGDPDQFKEYYKMSPQEMKDFMFDQMEKQLILQKMQGNVFSSISITPKEVKKFFKNIPKDSLPFFNSEIELAEIVIKPQINPAEDKRALELAQKLHKQITEDSVDFGELAGKFSADPGSASRGGVLGVVPRGQLVPEYEAVAYQLEKDEVSEIVKTQYGYHIIQLIERLGNNINTRHILIKPEITEADQQQAVSKLDSIRKLILLDTLTFDQAILRFSEDEFSKTRAGALLNPQTGEPYFEMGDLDPEVYFAVVDLEIGEMSKPIPYQDQTGESNYRLVKIRNKTEPHVANLKDDYSKIQTAALEEKKGRFIQEWVDRKIQENYIQIKPGLNLGNSFGGEMTIESCDVLKKWLEHNALNPNKKP
ncbi:MAG: peptidylprolyl isomerase [Aureispira sp.]|nr:peptidylprolyl isomerase [Aureispira sp.]